MSIELKIPEVGESVQEVQIGKWLKQEGDQVEQDEELVELETDKASLELPAPTAGTLVEILKKEGERVAVGEVIGRIDESGGEGKSKGRAESKQEADSEEEAGDEQDIKSQAKEATETTTKSKPQKPKAKPAKAESNGEPEQVDAKDEARADADTQLSAENLEDEVSATPSARRALREHGLSAEDVQAEGERLRREDVDRYVKQTSKQEEQEENTSEEESDASVRESAETTNSELEEVVPMSLIRRRIAARLVEAQQNAALLTTFNEIDMSAVMELRQEFREEFKEEYGLKLGYMPFFVKAVIDALRHYRELNAEIRDESIVYRNYYHIGVAIGGEKGLVVPVLKYAERMSFADIEAAIDDFAQRALTNKLKPSDLEGGTFTITNGGVYGSLLSTPIVNPPESGVLGMHAIEDRPVAREGQIVIRPMMYVALTYDHRIVDGREAVSFLKRVREAIEEPSRMLIEV